MQKPERNAACACGSGKKYKKCCGRAAPTGSARLGPTGAVRPLSGNVRPAAAARLRSAPGAGVGPPPDELRRLVALAAARRHAELEAGARGLLSEFPDSGVLWKLLGLSQWVQGKEMLPSLQRASELLPEDAEAHSNLGNAFRAAGQFEDAVACQRRALAVRPDYAEAHNNLGSALADLGRWDEAVGSFRQAVAIKPDFALAHSNLGNALMLQNHPEEAEPSCRRALELDPRLTSGLVQLAEIQATRGRFDEAEQWLRKAISIEPDMPEAWSGLVRLRKMTASDVEWLTQARRIAAQGLPPRREVHLRYALGKYFDDVGDYRQAFDNYRRANELSNKGRPEGELTHLTRGIDRIIRSHTREWLSRVRAGSSSSPRPVFIVGMPRSGTTLAEQILASHHDVHGAGELDFWSKAAQALDSTASDADEATDLARLAEDYLRLLSSLCADSARVVDKMPGNFLYLGLIHAALPNARIIHMRREPIDTCLSIYFHDFGRAHPYASDLTDLAAYFKEYARLMDHWRRALPEGIMLDLPYEELVRDQEAWSRKMVEFIGLAWDPNCLEFHRTSRAVSTLSKWQARQRINTSSVGRWRNYQQFVGPLLQLANLGEGARAET